MTLQSCSPCREHELNASEAPLEEVPLKM